MGDIEIRGGCSEAQKETFTSPTNYNYSISYCGLDKEGKDKCNFYFVKVKQNVIGSELFFIERDLLKNLTSVKGFEKTDKRAYSIAKNIAKLFYRDIVPDELKSKIKIIDSTIHSKLLNF